MRTSTFLDSLKLAAATVAIVGFIALLVAAERRERREWAEFAAANGCRVIREEKAQHVSGGHFDAKGNWVSGSYTIPSRTTWRCANEQEFVR